MQGLQAGHQGGHLRCEGYRLAARLEHKATGGHRISRGASLTFHPSGCPSCSPGTWTSSPASDCTTALSTLMRAGGAESLELSLPLPP